MKFQINKKLVPMKAHYFLWNAGTGPVVPYLSLYANQLGFSSAIVGLIYAILPVCGMIAKPLFGALADRFHCQKIIFLVAQLVTAAAFLSIFYSPKVPNESLISFSCDEGVAVFHNGANMNVDAKLLEKIQGKNTLATCELTCEIFSKDLPVLCNDWQLSQYCDNSSDVNKLSKVTFLTSVPLSKTVLSNASKVVNGKNVSLSIAEFRAANVTIDNRNVKSVCASGTIKSLCNFRCNDVDVNNLILRNQLLDEDVYKTYQFWVFLLLMIIAWIGQAISVSIGDAICFEILEDKPNRYGYQRMYGALGWGILSLLSGVIIDKVSADKSYTDYTVSFYLAAGFLVLDFFVSSRLRCSQSKLSTNILKDVGKLLLNVRVVVFLLWCIAVGMCTGLIWQFLLWLVRDLCEALGLKNIDTLNGILMGVQCLGGELPFFFLSGKILKKIGHVNAMSLVLFTVGIRFILYSVIENPWYFIPIEFSNGLTFGLFYACMASYASIVAPPGTETTMQGLVGAVFEGAGVSLGSYLAGKAQTKVSSSLTFRYFGIGALGACAIHIVVQYLLQLQDASVERERKDSFEKVKQLTQQELTSAEPLISR